MNGEHVEGFEPLPACRFQERGGLFRVQWYLAVVDPEKPGRYLLGVECDGATYHSARSARDRDRLRQEVLEGLGWRIHRIWSTDWFRNPENELKRLVKAIEEARLYAGNPENTGQAERSNVADVVRDTESNQFTAPSIPAYEMADLRFIGSSDAADWVGEIVRVESPVHIQEVSRRITKAASIKHTGSRIRATIESGCDEAIRKGRARRRGAFLWRPDMREAPLRDRSVLPSASKKLDLVAPEEIAAAIEKVVTESYGIDRDEIPTAVLRLLGFRRTTKTAQQRVTEVLDGMIAQAKLAEEGKHVSLRA
jgi:hypothetical protein